MRYDEHLEVEDLAGLYGSVDDAQRRWYVSADFVRTADYEDVDLNAYERFD